MGDGPGSDLAAREKMIIACPPVPLPLSIRADAQTEGGGNLPAVADYDLGLARTIVCAAQSGEVAKETARLSARCRRTTGRGFTFIAIMIALVIFGLLLTTPFPLTAIGLPLSSWRTTPISSPIHSISLVARRSNTAIASTCAKPATGASAATSAAGSRAGYCSSMTIALGQVDDDTIVLRREGPVGDGITMHGNRPMEDYVSYTSLGHARLLSGALQMGTFVIGKPRQNARSRSCWRTADEHASTRPRIAVLSLVVPFFGGNSALVRHLAKAGVRCRHGDYAELA
jgi:hypothetical protein